MPPANGLADDRKAALPKRGRLGQEQNALK